MSWQHGASGYRNYGCKCNICTDAHRERHKTERESRKRRLEADPSLAPHGEKNTYLNWGCRCKECKSAWSIEMKRQSDIRKQARGLKAA